MSTRSVPAARAAIAGACLFAVLALTYVRLFFGVDFTDESFYIAVPLRFVMGARPLIDETWLVQQTPGVVLYPFVKVYVALFGLDGIVLFARHLHLLFSVAVAAAVFLGLRPVTSDVLLRAVPASAAVAFVPFGIHGLSYNTFGSGFLSAGLFLGFAWLFDGRRRYVIAAGTAQGLAVFVYPPLAIAVACSFAALYACSRRRAARGLRSGLLTTGLMAVATIAFFTHEGLARLLDIVSQGQDFGGQGGGLGKVTSIASSGSTTFTQKPAALIALIVLFCCYRWRREYALIPLLALPVIALPLGLLNESGASNEFVTNFALFGPVVFLLVRRSPVARGLFAVVWLPSAVAGVVTAYSSANGGINLGIGLFPASVATATLLALAIQSAGEPSGTAFREIAAVASAVVFVGLCLVLQYTWVYRDAPIRELTTRVSGGAYSGLVTTPATRTFLQDLEADLRAVSRPQCRIVFYYTFPAGYLLDRGKGLTNSAWLIDVRGDYRAEYQGRLMDYYAKQMAFPDVAVRVNRVAFGSADGSQPHSGSEARELFTAPQYVVVRDRPDYRIFRLATTKCLSREPPYHG